MRVTRSNPTGTVPRALTEREGQAVEEPVPGKPEAEPVDIKAMAEEVAETEAEVVAMEEAGKAQVERIWAAQESVTVALREYAKNPDDATLELVDQHKKDEEQARKRMFVGADVLKMRQADLVQLRGEYDVAVKKAVDRKRRELLEVRTRHEKDRIKILGESMLILLTNLHLQGQPVGTVNYSKFIQRLLPTLREDVEAEVRKLLKTAEDSTAKLINQP